MIVVVEITNSKDQRETKEYDAPSLQSAMRAVEGRVSGVWRRWALRGFGRRSRGLVWVGEQEYGSHRKRSARCARRLSGLRRLRLQLDWRQRERKPDASSHGRCGCSIERLCFGKLHIKSTATSDNRRLGSN